MKKLTSTSYALLGLLSVRAWTAYELANYMQRSTIGAFWSRAISRIYDEPKKLVAHGFATSYAEEVSGRKRAVYEITDEGLRALDVWLQEPADKLQIEYESMLKLLLTDYSDRETIDDRMKEISRQTSDMITLYLEASEQFLDRGFTMPSRLPNTLLGAAYGLELIEAQHRWISRSREMLSLLDKKRTDETRTKAATEQYRLLREELLALVQDD